MPLRTHRRRAGSATGRVLAWAAAGLLVGCASLDAPPVPMREPGADADQLLFVAFDDSAPSMPAAGATPRRDYRRGAGYAGGAAALATAADIAGAHALSERNAWTIAPLRLRCVLYQAAPGTDRAALIAALALDPRVRLAQPLNSFETAAQPAADAPGPARAAASDERYNDPYVGLQRGFAAIDAAEAQRFGRGDGVRVAIIDTAVDAGHPDLDGRVGSQRDFVGMADATGAEQHGTEVAGVIAAGANNKRGIVGIAPAVRLVALRACWGMPAKNGAAQASRCDSFTLAQGLGAAIASGADVINLSLGGPSDPLLQRLTEHAIRRGVIVVAAVPPSGRIDGFPAGVPGVIAVSALDAPAPGSLAAPGRDILTLTPGGRYDYASGSSLATAHVSGAVALLKSLQPSLDGAGALALLRAGGHGGGQGIDLCEAVRRLRSDARCRDAR